MVFISDNGRGCATQSTSSWLYYNNMKLVRQARQVTAMWVTSYILASYNLQLYITCGSIVSQIHCRRLAS